ncbi:hypothetical protein BD324DRAFT_629658 [Kockovaella imperatae]|uniref:Uncharacterized protein n=1 Tax=Kockovaella imperatae TaxID=4999 RepID=A0A1Y1UD27_9TREE|nr:hypothetical protein BD324DRAFT_629658 [Kockovaella imperatae]ORX35958.1 hypothetical protein BD324DRAFT_629658 [Kockovaella imperatae]
MTSDDGQGLVPAPKKWKGKGKEKACPLLPDEVWRRVFEILYDSYHQDWQHEIPLTTSLSPLLICKDLNKIALSVLYAHPHIQYGAIPSFITSISSPNESSNTRRSYVHDITLNPSPTFYELCTGKAPGIHPSLDTLLPLLPTSLNSITLKEILITRPSSAQYLFDALALVRPRKARLEIRLWDLSRSPIGRDLYTLSKTGPYRANLRGCPRNDAQEWEINGPNGETPQATDVKWFQDNWLRAMNSNQELEIRIGLLDDDREAWAQQQAQVAANAAAQRQLLQADRDRMLAGAANAMGGLPPRFGRGREPPAFPPGANSPHNPPGTEGARPTAESGISPASSSIQSASFTRTPTSSQPAADVMRASSGADGSAVNIEDGSDRLLGAGYQSGSANASEEDATEVAGHRRESPETQTTATAPNTVASGAASTVQGHPNVSAVPGSETVRPSRTSRSWSPIGYPVRPEDKDRTSDPKAWLERFSKRIEDDGRAPPGFRWIPKGERPPAEEPRPPVTWFITPEAEKGEEAQATQPYKATLGESKEDPPTNGILRGKDCGESLPGSSQAAESEREPRLGDTASTRQSDDIQAAFNGSAMRQATGEATEDVPGDSLDDGTSNLLASATSSSTVPPPNPVSSMGTTVPGPGLVPAPQGTIANPGRLPPHLAVHAPRAKDLPHIIRDALYQLLESHWMPHLQALSLVALDPMASIVATAPRLDFWNRVAVPRIRVHLPRGINSLAVFKGSKEVLRERRSRDRLDAPQNQAPLPVVPAGLRPQQQPQEETPDTTNDHLIVGGDGQGGGLIHESNRLFEIEVNSQDEMDDLSWIHAGDQLPPQACRILAGVHDWNDVPVGQSR